MSINSLVILHPYPSNEGGSLHTEAETILKKHIKNIEIFLIVSENYSKYTAFFLKDSHLIYFPSETQFTTKSWENLKQQILIELRTAKMSEFVGILNRKKIIEYIEKVEL